MRFFSCQTKPKINLNLYVFDKKEKCFSAEKMYFSVKKTLPKKKRGAYPYAGTRPSFKNM